jgi:hypothetical protein
MATFFSPLPECDNMGNDIYMFESMWHILNNCYDQVVVYVQEPHVSLIIVALFYCSVQNEYGTKTTTHTTLTFKVVSEIVYELQPMMGKVVKHH